MTFHGFYKGTIKYTVKCKNTEGFINLTRNKASLNKLKLKDKDIISFVCFCNEEKAILDAVKKFNAEILSFKKRGLPVYFSLFRKRLGLVVGGLVFLALMFASTFFIWEVRIEGNEKLRNDEIELMLSKAGLSEGMLKKSINVKSIVNKVLIAEDELSWLSVNFDGTVAHVEVKEAKIGIPAEKKENVNLVASHNGIILRVDALEGESKVSAGDAVEKGNLLVSAFVEKRTGGSLLRGARGFVWAETEREYKVCVPLEYNTKKYTGREKNIYRLDFLGMNISLLLPSFAEFEYGDRKTYKNESRLTQDIFLPFESEYICTREYSLYKCRRTEQCALEIARETAKERLAQSSPAFKIADVSEKYETVEGILLYNCIFSGVENIAEKQEFELS